MIINETQIRVLEELKKLYRTNYPLGCIHDCFEKFDINDLLAIRSLNDHEELEILREFVEWGLKHD